MVIAACLLLAGSQAGTVRQVPRGQGANTQLRLKIPYKYKEPNPGYLSEFTWLQDPEVQDNQRPGSNWTSTVAAEVVKAMKASNIPGAAIAITKGDKIVYEAGFGYSNLAKSTPFRSTTSSRIGSISKTATALAVLRATELGSPFTLDDIATDHLSTPPNMKKWTTADKTNWDKAKIRHFLDHRSGIDGSDAYLTSKALHDSWEVKGTMNRAQLIYGLRKNNDLNTPGSSYVYHNRNYEVVSELLEETTQKDFGDAIDALLCKPLGIPTAELHLSPTYTAANVPAVLPYGEARSYQFRSDFTEDFMHSGNTYPEAYGGLNGQVLSGAGHIAFSARAIAKMVIALRTQPKSFMSQAKWDEITTKPTGEPTNGYYSKGVKVFNVDGTFCYNHGAMLMHGGGQFHYFNKDVQFVVIANSNTKSGQLVDVILANAVRTGLQKMGAKL